MNYRIFTCISFLFFGIKSDRNDRCYTEEDFKVIGTLTKYFHSSSIVFVKSDADVNFFKKCREFLEADYYYGTVNPSFLAEIFGNDDRQIHFFQTRTVIVTKEQLNLTELLDEVLLPHYLTWIIFRNDIREMFYIPASCNVFFINSTTKPISVEQVYHVKRGHEMVKTTWSQEMLNPRGKLYSSVSPQLSKINLRNISLNLHILRPRKSCQEEEGELLKKLGCTHQALVMLLAVRLNFSINFTQCRNLEHPYVYPNGSDSELFLKLKNREVDFSTGVTRVAEASHRRPFLDYVWPTFIFRTRMYLKQAKVTGRWASYLKPLEASVWWCILTCITVTGVLMKIFEKLIGNNLKLDCSFIYELIMSTFRALQVFCNQAVVDLSSSYSIRIIFILTFFVVLIFYQAYCGYLVSSLTVVVTRFPFTDLSGFLKNQQYRIMTRKRGFQRYYFRNIVLDGHDENLMLPDEDLPLTTQEAVDKLCAEDYLALGEFREDLLNFISYRCKISELPSPLIHSYFGIGVPRKTPLKEYLNREMLHLHSTGIMHRMGSHLATSTSFGEDTSNEYSRVSIMHVFSVFILLHMGIGISLVILCLEIIVKTSGKSSVQKRKLRFNRDRTNSSRFTSGLEEI